MSDATDDMGGVADRPRVRPLHEGGRPLVVDYRKRRKRRRSKGLEEVQDLEAGISRGLRRAARAAAKGTSTYDKERRRSARKKRDGAIRDFVPNMGEAMSASLREASDIPADITDSLNTRATRRRVRRRTREVSRALRGWRV